MPRYFIEVSYKGTRYSGFQEQQNANTVQAEVTKALATRFRESIILTGASRTDTGVHALQNYFHFDIERDLFHPESDDADSKTVQRSLYSLNSMLPFDIVIKRIFRVADGAHCRYDAVSRKYRYYIYGEKNPFYKDIAHFYPYPMEIGKLEQAAAVIQDTKDFTSFSKRNTQVNNFICSIYKSKWQKENNCLVYEVIANRFLRGMVRGLVGTMLKVGTGKTSLDEFTGIIKNNNSEKADFSVPPGGLFLVEIKYESL